MKVDRALWLLGMACWVALMACALRFANDIPTADGRRAAGFLLGALAMAVYVWWGRRWPR